MYNMELWCPDSCLCCDTQTVDSIYCSECSKHRKQPQRSQMIILMRLRDVSSFPLRPVIDSSEYLTRKRPLPAAQDALFDSSKSVRRSRRNGWEDEGLSSQQKQLLLCYSLLFDPVRSSKRRLISAKSNGWQSSSARP